MSAVKRLGALAIVAILAILAVGSFSGSASAYPPGHNPVIHLSHTSGPVGDKVTVTGQHFTPGKPVPLTFHSAPIALGTVPAATPGGTFSFKITIPNDPLGLHQVVALDFSGQTASADFTITGSGTGSGGGIAGTGVAVIGISAVGLVLLVGGGLMQAAGRRRRRVDA
jgi:hypothetical protein